MITVPLTPRQAAVIQEAAARAGLPVDEYARRAALDRALAYLRVVAAERGRNVNPMPTAGRGAELAALVAARAVEHGKPAALADLCEICPVVMTVTGAAVWLAANSERRVLAYATDAVSQRLDDFQLTLGEGPCVDAWDVGGPVLAEDLRTLEMQARWPAYGPAAIATGAQAVFAFPLRSGAISAGMLQLYRSAAGELSRTQLADALTIADLALDMILARLHRGSAEQGMLPWDGGDGLGAGRAEVYQATGMVAVQLRVGLEDALAELRRYAVERRRTLSEVALDVVARRLRWPVAGATTDPRGPDTEDDHGS
ncbi:GAF and ANTAR domain-containing protein [Actinomadura barringtoniae]|uniref:GAF and ANTAR domain-containing protein n=1 Tax=Actinomadura barringtoniae TaxID=1427535 RepID=A0A939PNT4_9ACTN|nr:GAF and ANTAR domain-containing protein [Actinomadura barringtoniae]MBO2452479.1 GAF and ANTAR domain-containing protein [Actinomadura barringtoniae]